MTVVAYDKNTMARVSSTVIYDRKDPAQKEQYKELNYYGSSIFENTVYIFWKRENREVEELYSQTYDGKLNSLNKLKKIYEIETGRKKNKKAGLFISECKENETILIGAEQSGDKGEKIKLQYKLLKSDFSYANSGQIELPLIIESSSYGLSSSYVYGKDGNLHIRSYIRMDKEERKQLKKHESDTYSLYTLLDPRDNSYKTFTLRFENKNTFNIGMTIEKDKSKIFGFFCDLDKDPKGSSTHGVLYATIDTKLKELSNVNFSYFTKAQLDKLFATDKQDRNKAGSLASKKKKEAASESLGGFYEIEQVESIDDDIVLFCSIMVNTSSTTCDGKGNCRTTYYCRKNNVTVFRINSKGEIVWASNLDRSITYNGWNVFDVKVINHEKKKFYVAYGSATDIAEDGKGKKGRKTAKEARDKFEYAVFDYETGNFKKEEYVVNAPNTAKPDMKYISVRSLIKIDNKFYVESDPSGGMRSGCYGGGCFFAPSVSEKRPAYLGVINTSL